MTEILLPVGQPLGIIGDPAASLDQASASVRIADDWVDLTPVQYRLWMLAFKYADRAALQRAAESAEVSDVDPALTAFVDRGLLLAVDPAEDLRDVLDRHCILPAGFGLGNSTSHPGYYEIAGADLQPRVRVELDIYLAWGNAHRASLWASCEIVAEQQDVDPNLVAAHIVTGLPALISSGTTLLDQLS